MKTIKRYFSILLVLSMMMCYTSVFTVSAVPTTEDEMIVIEVEEDLGGEDELQPMVANSCTGAYIPDSWTIDTSYRGASIDYVCYLHGWTLNGDYIMSNGTKIGMYHAGHLMDNQWTVAHFHIFGDSTHYVF